ncbi:hypothetical protein I5Q39_24475 [Serratia marcescens]|uniref:hypothetical protein n=1 Tax=Serratia marcescens TaxID=615 RepID=UPI0011C141BF|nr:hypothetical protein [Serratia marcescens]MBH2894842.1 hypothetical protein [Serratia marcescens]
MKKAINFKFLQLNERKLSEQWMFWLSISIPLALSITLSIPLWLQTKINISAEGYDNFLRIFKLPIGVLSLSIPLVAIVAHIHRTIQTAEQIQTTRRKNAADSFFSHHKFMIEALGKVATKDIALSNCPVEYKIGDPYQLYDNFFTHSSYENGINTSFLGKATSSIECEINKIEGLLIKSRDNEGNKIEKIHSLRKISDSIKTIESDLTIAVPKFKTNNLVMDRVDGVTVLHVMDYRDEPELKERLRSLVYITKKIFQIINTPYLEPDTVCFYSNLSTPNYYFFNEVFDDVVLTKMSIRHGITVNGARKYDKHYQEYSSTLAKRKAGNAV